MKNFDQSEAIDLESDLNPTYFQQLSTHGKRASFEAGRHIFYQGEAARYVFLLTDGSLKTTRSDDKGYDTLLKIHQVGSLVGLSALRPKAARDANCIAVDNAEVRRFGRTEFFNLMRRDGELGILLVQILLKRQQLLHSRISDVTGLSVEQRLARVLVQMHLELDASAQTAEQVTLRISHEDLAALVFSRRQYITAILGKFVESGLVENKRQQLRVLNVERLLMVVSG
ncbi:Crp/Fnr family transcriptional regulator [Roseobacter sp.]|uniref:Crp/Fnr family transcriptional regulator n=1 Tax=Roseobacter sp. TaxID=1907202 RepID=UPI00385EE728